MDHFFFYCIYYIIYFKIIILLKLICVDSIPGFKVGPLKTVDGNYDILNWEAYIPGIRYYITNIMDVQYKGIMNIKIFFLYIC